MRSSTAMLMMIGRSWEGSRCETCRGARAVDRGRLVQDGRDSLQTGEQLIMKKGKPAQMLMKVTPRARDRSGRRATHFLSRQRRSW